MIRDGPSGAPHKFPSSVEETRNGTRHRYHHLPDVQCLMPPKWLTNSGLCGLSEYRIAGQLCLPNRHQTIINIPHLLLSTWPCINILCDEKMQRHLWQDYLFYVMVTILILKISSSMYMEDLKNEIEKSPGKKNSFNNILHSLQKARKDEKMAIMTRWAYQYKGR